MEEHGVHLPATGIGTNHRSMGSVQDDARDPMGVDKPAMTKWEIALTSRPHERHVSPYFECTYADAGRLPAVG